MKRLYLSLIPFLTTLLLLPTTTAFSFQSTSGRSHSILLTSNLSKAKIRQIAQAVTVRIFTNKRGGSGVLVGKQGQTYTVLTNAHVVNAKGSYTIQTSDGKVRQAVVKYRGDSLKGNDLALLEFTSTNNYRIVELATDADAIENQEVYASGFPYDTQQFTLTTGKISVVSDRPFIGGYQIGYSNEIKQGMSGGALLNGEGQLIGINGLIKYPILSDTFTYQDGSQPSKELRQQLQKLSFAVPIATLVKIAPKLASRPSNNRNNSPSINSSPPSPKLTGLPAQIDAVAQQITVRIDASDPKNGNGSGVIIGRQGNTYYVVTNDHVVVNPGSYEIVAPDGEKYRVTSNKIIRGEGLDVAILPFQSQKTYQIATLARSYDSQDGWVFLGGFPASTGKKWKLTAGLRFSKYTGTFLAKDNYSLSDGYELVYTNLSFRGMSGGPVLDVQGRVIGIGGRQDGEEATSKVERNLRYALGVPTANCLNLLTKAKIKLEGLKIETSPPRDLTALEVSSIQNQPSFTVEKPPQDADENQWLNYGNGLWRGGRWDEAVTALNQVLKMKPDFPEAYYALGLVLLNQKKYSEAVASFDKAVKLNFSFYEAWREQSTALIGLEKYPEALIAIDEAIAVNKQDFLLYVSRASILYSLKLYSEAQDTLTEAIKIKPNSEIAYYNRGTMRYELKQYPEALADFTKAIEISPQYAYAYNNRGNIRKELKQYPEALADFTKAIEMYPQYAYAYSNRGGIRKELKQYPEALADFDRAIAINPEFTEAYNNRGIVRTDLKQYPKAIADFDVAIKINPQYAQAYYNRGVVRKDLKQYPKAIDDFNRAIKINPLYADAYVNRGVVYQELKQYPEALADYAKALEIDPQLSKAYSNRGIIRYEQEKYQEAIADFDRAIAIDSQDAIAYSNRGRVYQELKQYPEALADYAKAIEINPQLSNPHYNRGGLYYEQEKYQEAIADYTKAIKRNPQYAEAYGNRGAAHRELKNYPSAIADFQTAAQLFQQQKNLEMYQFTQELLKDAQSSYK
jgi:tetratricopeptide (TPR) repeat protein/S1-C subfamily serine protease